MSFVVKNGAVRFYLPHTNSNGDLTVGPDRMYAFPADEVENIMASTNGDLGALETALGFKTGTLKNNPEYKVVFLSPDQVQGQLSLPNGNELGANGKWLPGGFTSGGVPEIAYSGSDLEADYSVEGISEFLDRF